MSYNICHCVIDVQMDVNTTCTIRYMHVREHVQYGIPLPGFCSWSYKVLVLLIKLYTMSMFCILNNMDSFSVILCLMLMTVFALINVQCILERILKYQIFEKINRVKIVH